MLNPSIWMSIQSEKEHCPTKGETNKSDDEGISFECRGSGNVVVVWAEYPTSAGLSWRWCDCTSAVDVGGCGGEIAGCWGSVGTHCVVARDGAIAGGAIARRLRCWREDLGGGENKSAGARADLSVGAKTDKGWKGGRRDDCLTDVLGRLLLLRLWTRQREERRGTHLCSGQERKGKSSDEPSRPHDGRGQNVKCKNNGLSSHCRCHRHWQHTNPICHCHRRCRTSPLLHLSPICPPAAPQSPPLCPSTPATPLLSHLHTRPTCLSDMARRQRQQLWKGARSPWGHPPRGLASWRPQCPHPLRYWPRRSLRSCPLWLHPCFSFGHSIICPLGIPLGPTLQQLEIP